MEKKVLLCFLCQAFATALQTDISGLISALPSLGVRENVTMLQFSENEAIFS